MPGCGLSLEIFLDTSDPKLKLVPVVEVTPIPLATGLRETSGRRQGGDDDPEARARLQKVEPGQKDARMVIDACRQSFCFIFVAFGLASSFVSWTMYGSAVQC